MQNNFEKELNNQINPIIKIYNEPIMKTVQALSEMSNYFNLHREQFLVISSVADTYKKIIGIEFEKIREQLLTISEPIANVTNAFKSIPNESIINFSKQMSGFFKEYNSQINLLVENMANIMYISSIKDMYEDINFDKIIVNSNGTIEYEGIVFEKEDVKENTKELIEDINKENSLNINTMLKKIIISFICCFALLCFPQEIFQWFILALDEGFKGFVGLKMVEYITEIFKKRYPSTRNKGKTYLENHCAIVKLEELKVRKLPDVNQNIIGCLYCSQLVNIIDIKPYWAKIEYSDKENQITIIGWVSTKGLKKFNTLTSQFEEIEENELGA